MKNKLKKFFVKSLKINIFISFVITQILFILLYLINVHIIISIISCLCFFSFLLYIIFIPIKNTKKLIEMDYYNFIKYYNNKYYIYKEIEKLIFLTKINIEKDFDLDNSKKEFISNVSHELKTPLTSIKLLADSLLFQDNNINTYKEFMHDISNEINRLNDIINNLLNLIKINNEGSKLDISNVNITKLVEACINRLKLLSNKLNINIRYEIYKDIFAEIDSIKFSLSISNIIENAIKYSKRNSSVYVSVNADNKFFYIDVKDEGIGISEKDINHIFDRFYRCDKSHSQKISGTGLGLSIARDIINLHKGSIKVSSYEGIITLVSIKVPLIFNK